MAKRSKGRFTWQSPVVKPNEPVSGGLEHRLRNHSEVRPNKSKIKDEYDAFVKKRRGQSE